MAASSQEGGRQLIDVIRTVAEQIGIGSGLDLGPSLQNERLLRCKPGLPVTAATTCTAGRLCALKGSFPVQGRMSLDGRGLPAS